MEIKTENNTSSQFVLFLYYSAQSPTATKAVHNLFFRKYFNELPSHKYVLGSAKFWYSDDSLDESRLTVEISVGTTPFNKIESEEPCLILNLPRRKSDFEYVYFGEAHDHSSIYFTIKVQVMEQSQYHLD